MTMHPVIRIICLLLMAGFVASGVPVFVLVSLLILICIYMIARLSVLVCWYQVKRLRWFFLSILVVYFWFTPGQAFSPELANTLWVPSIEGVKQGLLRVACLVLIVAAVSALLQSTSREQLVSALFSLFSWTSYIGLSAERMAVRITLTLEYLLAVQSMLTKAKAEIPAATGLRARITNLANVSTEVFVNVHDKAESEQLDDVSIETAEPVNLLQWLFPVLLLALYIAVITLFPVLK